MFFQLLFVPYVLLALYVAAQFHEFVLRHNFYYKRLARRVNNWPAPFKWVANTVLILLYLAITFFATPAMGIALIVVNHRDKRRYEAECKEREEKRRIADEERKAENIRRAEARKQWLVDNRPKLYCKTVSGITAVLRPAEYEAVQKQTLKNRRNGFWEKDNVLCPARETVVFVTKQGREFVEFATGSETSARYKVGGWLSDLDEIIHQGNVQMINVDDIFVPWVNESIVKFVDQRQMFDDCYSRATYYHLIEEQAPEELHPI